MISSVPVTPELLQSATARLGSVTLIPPDRRATFKSRLRPTNPDARNRVEAGHVPPPSNRFDPTFRFYTIFNAVDWETGKSQDRCDWCRHPAIDALRHIVRHAGRQDENPAVCDCSVSRFSSD